MNKKKLIVNADDLGQSSGINAGIIKAHEQGIVTSASLMVRYPAVVDAAMYAKKNSDLGVGLHVDLGEWIFKNGEWTALYEVVSLDNIKEIGKEVNAQLESFYRIMDREPTHIDSHQHVHLRKEIAPVLLELAGKLNITLRGYSQRVRYCGNFYGQLEDGSPYHEAISVDGLKKVISGLPGGVTELACHPGLNNDVQTMYRIEREMELDTLCDPAIRKAILAARIELCSFEGISF